MNRHDLISALPAETPVMKLFREWHEANAAEAAALDAHPEWADDAPEAKELDRHAADTLERLAEAPASSPLDALLKVCAFTDFGEGEYSGSEPVWAEVRAMVGAAA